MLESLLSENQIVLVPRLVNQILVTKLLVKELKVAMEVEREEDGRFSKESLSEVVKFVRDKESEGLLYGEEQPCKVEGSSYIDQA